MHFKKGYTRFVLVIPTLRIAFKFPNLRRPFHGITNNWLEFYFYLKTKHLFLQPTFFSFFGICNIQLYGEPCCMEQGNFWEQLYGMTSCFPKDLGSALSRDGHHWEFQSNFCKAGEKLRIVDYGSKATQKLILEFGEKIYQNFSISFEKHI